MDIQDLDVLVPQPKRAKMGGAMYELPADLPMEIFLRLNLAQTAKGEDGEVDMVAQINAVIAVIGDLFTWQLVEQGAPQEQIEAAKGAVEAVVRRRGARYGFSLVQTIYKDDDEKAEEAAAAADPTQPQVPPVAA